MFGHFSHTTYAPKNTSASVNTSSSVLEGRSVTLTCSSDANPAVNYTWSRESEGQMEQLQTGDTLTFDRIDLKHRGCISKLFLTCLYCVVGVCCRDFSISLPQNFQALSGSCVIIKCRFEIEEKHDINLVPESAATGLWLKDGDKTNEHLVFHSTDHKSNHFNGKITGNLLEKNCTTVFYNVSSKHTGRYYFRIESGGLKYVYTVNTSTINVIDSPPKPTVQLYVEQKQVQDQEEGLEGSSVSLRCSAETLCSSPPPTLTWSSTPRIPLSESSRLEELISDLNFTATHRQHRVTFTCTITYQLQDENKTAQDNITLHVQYSPKNTSVSVLPSSSVLEGRSVTLTCSSDANPAVLNYTWSRESEGQMEQLQTGHTLTFDRIDLKHRGWYHCTAQNQHGTQNSSVMLDIQYAPKISPSSSCARTDVTVCFCEADGNPSPELEWHLSGRPVTNSSNTFISEERLSSTGLRSSITLHQCQEDESSPVYANNAMLSPTGAEKELHYASIDFTNIQPESEEIRGVSSLTTDYAVVRCYPGGLSEAESSIGGDQLNSGISASAYDPLSTLESTYNGHVSIRTGRWSSGRRLAGQMSPIFFYTMWTAVLSSKQKGLSIC
ncbi:myelin-associated glycoprotein-like [Sinocyclocheilus grahami]|uniref:myelin-associated glycoprotein-like n=1 Tax=Sinocyclocheilus grahami TaxID=75366 RepID=UPI0007AC7866|nr:PREDICTED: myelin-associated glycoprotein-like [Sinocyclocheilus grahami]